MREGEISQRMIARHGMKSELLSFGTIDLNRMIVNILRYSVE